MSNVSILSFEEAENILIKPEYILGFSSNLRIETHDNHIQFFQKKSIVSIFTSDKFAQGQYQPEESFIILQTHGSLLKKEVSKLDNILVNSQHLLGYTRG